MCLTLCDPIDGSPPGSPIPGILQARTLEWVAISFSNAWKWKAKIKLLSCVWSLATPWTAAYQAPPSMGLPRQEYWSGLPSPGHFNKYFVIFPMMNQTMNDHSLNKILLGKNAFCPVVEDCPSLEPTCLLTPPCPFPEGLAPVL